MKDKDNEIRKYEANEKTKRLQITHNQELKIINPCSKCQTGNLVVKLGKSKFLYCTNYPECTYIEKYEE